MATAMAGLEPQAVARTGGGSPPPALILTHLSKTFGGQRALDDVSLTVSEGEVHGLLGQNGCGKSTLIKVLAGFHAPDPGSELSIDGESVPMPLAPGAFRKYRVSFVHQHLGLIPSLSVVENFLIGRLAHEARYAINWRREADEVRAALERYGVALDPRAAIADISPVERALLAIVRAVEEMRNDTAGAVGKGILVLDEPTPFLPKRDVDKLFSVVRSVTKVGASVIFVSHDVDEVMEITDRATVLRDGHVAGTLITKRSTKQDFIEMIVGRRLEAYRRAEAVEARKPPGVAVSVLSNPVIEDVAFEVRQGEIVGLTGLIGSGYDEVPYLLYGAKKARSGTMDLGGGPLQLNLMTPVAALDRGVVLIPADRPNAAAIGTLSISDNVTMPVLGSVFNAFALNRNLMFRRAYELGTRFAVFPNRPDLTLSSLSGGNAQKVVLAKWLQRDPKLILLDEPTQGVDIGARQTVFRLIAEAAAGGASVICASSDYEQLEAICDRVLIFAGGRIVSELVGTQITKPAIAERCFAGNDTAGRG